MLRSRIAVITHKTIREWTALGLHVGSEGRKPDEISTWHQIKRSGAVCLVRGVRTGEGCHPADADPGHSDAGYANRPTDADSEHDDPEHSDSELSDSECRTHRYACRTDAIERCSRSGRGTPAGRRARRSRGG